MNLETKRLQSVQIGANADPVVLKCHQSRPDILSLGLKNGKVFFLKLSNSETYIMNAHEDSAEAIQDEATGEYPKYLMIEDLAWDPQEDNFLISFADKGMCLVSF